MAALWDPESDACGQRNVVGDVEDCSQFVLHPEVPHREGTSVAVSTSGEEQVLTRRVDRGPLHRVRVPVPVQADQDHDGDLLEAVDVLLHRVGEATRSVSVGLTLVVPPSPEGLTEQRFDLDRVGAVTQNEEPERLAVRPRRSPRCMPQDAREVVLVDRVVAVATDRAGRRQCLEDRIAQSMVHTNET